MKKILKPLASHNFESFIDKYVLIKPNHTFYRTWPIEKFFGGLFGGYFIIREVSHKTDSIIIGINSFHSEISGPDASLCGHMLLKY